MDNEKDAVVANVPAEIKTLEQLNEAVKATRRGCRVEVYKGNIVLVYLNPHSPHNGVGRQKFADLETAINNYEYYCD